MKQHDVVMQDSNEKANDLFGIDMNGPLPSCTAMQKRAPKYFEDGDIGSHGSIPRG